MRRNTLRRTRGVLRDAAVLCVRLWSLSHCKEKKAGFLHFIYKALRALRLLEELEGKCYGERNVTVQTKGGQKNAPFTGVRTLPCKELPGRNIPGLCQVPLRCGWGSADKARGLGGQEPGGGHLEGQRGSQGTEPGRSWLPTPRDQSPGSQLSERVGKQKQRDPGF